MEYSNKFYVEIKENRPAIYKINVAEPVEDELVFKSYEQIYSAGFIPVFYPLGVPLSKGLVLERGAMFDNLKELKMWVIKKIWSHK